MRKIIVFILILLAVIVGLTIYTNITFADEEKEFYKAITPDNTVTHINQVIVERWTPIEYDLEYCDVWEAEWQRRADEALRYKKDIEELRIKILKEAQKVKLKPKGEGT